MVFVLGGIVLVYLFGLILIGVFSPSPKPYDDPLPDQATRDSAADLTADEPAAPFTNGR